MRGWDEARRNMLNIPSIPYFDYEDFKLYLVDCTKFMESLPPDCIDLIFADPPYYLSGSGFTVHSGKRVSVNKGKWDESKGIKEDFKFHFKWINACKRVLKPSGTIWISGTYHSIYSCGFALQMAGYKILNDIAWFKPNAAPNLSCRYFAASHETLIWARKDPKAKHIFNYEEMKYGSWPEDQIKKPQKQMRSVWSIPTPSPNEKIIGKHPTQKPLRLLNRIITASSKEGDIVFDPFTGSSTTGIAAYNLGRKFIGTDMEEEYLRLSKKRFENIASLR